MTLLEYKELVLASFLKTLVITELEFRKIILDRGGEIRLLKDINSLNKYERTLHTTLVKLNKFQIAEFNRKDFNKEIMDNVYSLLFKGIENSKAWNKYAPMELFIQLVLLYNTGSSKRVPISNGKFIVRIMFYVNDVLRNNEVVKENSKKLGSMIWHNMEVVK